ncbi:histidine phosphatase family protein [Saccharopolyspora phatthalungensis]|uniref:Broad specificity phosphatase PhoE n=1 Tax=Saccharopolyspora phatthalungensis TaxID=664693 RepID=A0A840QDG4_9PSEU|nr:histidine phosphatase family protein [Saccharopolyspora phatthalungensis]MBB5158814.1 broad specificity phosphatase PhoE [Saccharopolyspora phatthalungensis]
MNGRRFVLARHGEAELNLIADDAEMAGFDADSPLTALGVRQAALLAAALPTVVERPTVFASPQLRAAATAAELGMALRVRVTTDARLAEVGAPARFATPMSGRQWEEVLDARMLRPDEEVAPGVESLAAQRHRVRSFLHERCSADGEYVMVSHAETTQALLLVLLGLESCVYSAFRFKVSRTGVFVIDVPRDGPPTLVTANTKAHLGGLV